jgi:hypothetical protein
MISCSISRKTAVTQPSANINSLRLLGQYTIPYDLHYKNTTVGGLSGIDYDQQHNRYYLISDDRSAINPARFYTANIFLTEKGINSIQFTGVTHLLQPNGKAYPGIKEDPYHTPDPEAIRFNPVNRSLVWSSEGERIVKKNNLVLIDPSIRIISKRGAYLDSFSIPPNMKMQEVESGPRQNSVFEGLSFGDNYKFIYVNVEEPLLQDGPRADSIENNAFIRILKFNDSTKMNIAQFAYKLEPVAYPANPSGSFKINGVSEILSIGMDKLLVVERSYSSGRIACTIKLFIANLAEATDIKDIPSLKQNTTFHPAPKKLLLNMDDLGIYIDNIEGVTFGPILPNGNSTLIFIADNNFSPFQQSQVLLFEINE